MDPKRQKTFGALTERWEDVQVVWRLLWDKQVDASLKIIPLLALLYLLSPVDLIPDLLLGPGQMDDVGVILLALALFLRLAPADRVRQARQGLGQSVDEVEVEVRRGDEES